MCTLDSKSLSSNSSDPNITPSVHGRPVLQPTCNRVAALESRYSLKGITPKTPPPPPPPPPQRATKSKPSTTSPTSPKLRSPRLPAVKRGNENTGFNSSSDKITIPKSTLTRTMSTLERKKSKNWIGQNNANNGCSLANGFEAKMVLGYSSSSITESPGSIAAVRREQMALQHAQRKMRIAHYGRSKSAKYEPKVAPLVESLGNYKIAENAVLERRCTSVTSNSDPLYVAYHDEEWGVPVHDDKELFELLVLCGAQVGSDWTSILRKRQDFRDAFSEFDAEIVANLTEKQMTTISVHYAIEMSRVRGVVDNANRILEIKKEFGSFDKYIWGFVSGKPISPQYKFAHKIPVKTSKSESISKGMVRRGFRTVGPTAIHSFMQAAGLTNDHLVSCYRQLECTALASGHTK